jgi:NADPH2:quinone reductase
MSNAPSQGLQVTTTVTDAGELELRLTEAPVPQPQADEVLIRVEATPINPSDIITLLGGVDPNTATFEGSAERPVMRAKLSPALAAALTGRKGIQLPVGLEGAGSVVAAGDEAKGLLGKRVAAAPGGMWSQYRIAKAATCMPLPDDVSSAEGASAFVNPMTALAMVEAMRLDGHSAIVHTAAASNLGQMLVKICREDGVPLVNVVRRPQQVELLRSLGATHIVNSGASTFREDLTAAVRETGATVGFDAIGGGLMAHEILSAMERVAIEKMTEYSPYGSFQPKQVHIYGLLDTSPLQLPGPYGFFWNVGGWMMPMVMSRISPERAGELSMRIMGGFKSTFASHYTRRVSLAEALQRDVVTGFHRTATGEKYLIVP